MGRDREEEREKERPFAAPRPGVPGMRPPMAPGGFGAGPMERGGLRELLDLNGDGKVDAAEIEKVRDAIRRLKAGSPRDLGPGVERKGWKGEAAKPRPDERRKPRGDKDDDEDDGDRE